MISKRDVQLGKIALEEKLVSKEQINKALKIKKKLKTKASLGAILVKKGYIDREQLELIVGIHNARSSDSVPEGDKGEKASARKRRSAGSARRKGGSARRQKASARRSVGSAREGAVGEEGVAGSEARATSDAREAVSSEPSGGAVEGAAVAAEESRAELVSRPAEAKDEKPADGPSSEQPGAKRKAKKRGASTRRSKRAKSVRRGGASARAAPAKPESSAGEPEAEAPASDAEDTTKSPRRGSARRRGASARRRGASARKGKAAAASPEAEVEAEASDPGPAGPTESGDEPVVAKATPESDGTESLGSDSVAVVEPATDEDQPKLVQPFSEAEQDGPSAPAEPPLLPSSLLESALVESGEVLSSDVLMSAESASDQVLESGILKSDSEVVMSDSLLKSADLNESTEYDAAGAIRKKIIACSDCGKKYRVKPAQAGKRFGCRRCATKVRVPGDYFEELGRVSTRATRRRPERGASARKAKRGGSARRAKKGASTRARASSARSEEQRGHGQSRALSPSVGAKGDGAAATTSYAQLAQVAATTAVVPTRKGAKMSASQVVQLIVFSSMLLAIVGAFFGYRQYLEDTENKRVADAVAAEWAPFEVRLTKEAADATQLLAATSEGLEGARALAEMAARLQGAATRVDDLGWAQNKAPGERLIRVTLKLSKLRHELLMKQARLLSATGSLAALERALEAYQRALEAEDTNIEAWCLYAQALARARRWKKATEVLARCEKKEGHDQGRILAMAGWVHELGDWASAAAEYYERLAKLDPLGGVLHARVLISGGATSDALRILDGLLARTDASAAPGSKALLLAYKAHNATVKGELEVASKLYSEAVAADPESPWSRMAYAEHCLIQGESARALSLFEAAFACGGGSRALLGVGRANEGLIELEKARTAYRRLLSGDLGEAADEPSVAGVSLIRGSVNGVVASSEAHQRLGDLYRAEGRDQAAIEAYREAGARDPFNLDAAAALALANLQKNLDGRARAQIETAMRLTVGIKGGRAQLFDRQPRIRSAQTARVFAMLGSIEQRAGNLERAESAYDLALEMATDDPGIVTRRASVLSQQNKRRQARAAYQLAARAELRQPLLQAGLACLSSPGDEGANRRAVCASELLLAGNPWNASAYLLRARAALARRAVAVARKDFDRAVENNPQRSEIYIDRGLCYGEQGPGAEADFELARRDFERALELEPRLARAHYGLALCASHQGELERALQQVSLAVDRDPRLALGFALRARIYTQLGQPDKAAEDQQRVKALAGSGGG